MVGAIIATVTAAATPIIVGVMTGAVIRPMLRPGGLIDETNALETDRSGGQRHQERKRATGKHRLLHERHRKSSILRFWKRSDSDAITSNRQRNVSRLYSRAPTQIAVS